MAIKFPTVTPCRYTYYPRCDGFEGEKCRKCGHTASATYKRRINGGRAFASNCLRDRGSAKSHCHIRVFIESIVEIRRRSDAVPIRIESDGHRFQARCKYLSVAAFHMENHLNRPLVCKIEFEDTGNAYTVRVPVGKPHGDIVKELAYIVDLEKAFNHV